MAIQTTRAADAVVGNTYNTPNGQPLTVKAKSNPGFVDVENAAGRVFPVPNDYTLVKIPKDNGIDWRSLVNTAEAKLRPLLPTLAQHQLDGLLAADGRIWLQVAAAKELESRIPVADTDPDLAECACCGATVALRTSVTRQAAVFVAHPSSDRKAMCPGVSRTPDEARELVDGDAGEIAFPSWRDLIEVGAHLLLEVYANGYGTGDTWAGELTDADDRTVTVTWPGDQWSRREGGRRQQARFSRKTGARIGDGGNGTERRLQLVGKVEAAPDAAPDVAGDVEPTTTLFPSGCTNSTDRGILVKTWTRTELRRCQLLWAAENWGELYEHTALQATVIREIKRHDSALTRIHEIPAATTKGRDELLRLRELSTTAKRPGLITTIDQILESTMIEGGEDTAAAGHADRLAGGDAPELEIEPRLQAHIDRWFPDAPPEQPTLFAIVEMVANVRRSRKAAAACQDPAAVRCAWLHVALFGRSPEATIAINLAKRYAKLGGGPLAHGRMMDPRDVKATISYATDEGLLIAVSVEALPEQSTPADIWRTVLSAAVEAADGRGYADSLIEPPRPRITVPDTLTMAEICGTYSTAARALGKGLQPEHLFEIDGQAYTCTGFRGDYKVAWIEAVTGGQVGITIEVSAEPVDQVADLTGDLGQDLEAVKLVRAFDMIEAATGEDLAATYATAVDEGTWRPQVVSAMSGRLQSLGWKFEGNGSWVLPVQTTPAELLRLLKDGKLMRADLEAACKGVRAWVQECDDPDAMLRPGMIVATSYDSGPYVVKSVSPGGGALLLRGFRSSGESNLNGVGHDEEGWFSRDGADRLFVMFDPDETAADAARLTLEAYQTRGDGTGRPSAFMRGREGAECTYGLESVDSELWALGRVELDELVASGVVVEKIPAVATEPDETNATAAELGEVIDGRDYALEGYDAKMSGAAARDNPHDSSSEHAEAWGNGYRLADSELGEVIERQGYEARLVGEVLNPYDGEACGDDALAWVRGYADAHDELAKVRAAGWIDHVEGKAIDASPYPVDRPAFRGAWRDGWSAAAEVELKRAADLAKPDPVTIKSAEPDRVTITLDDLELVSLPDGTRDVWAKLPDGGKRKIGTSTDPALVPYVAAFDDRAKAMRPTPTPTPAQIPTIPGNLDALGALGRALEAMADAGYECELTIRVGGAA